METPSRGPPYGRPKPGFGPFSDHATALAGM